jgi:aminoglycoside phosphotransferase
LVNRELVSRIVSEKLSERTVSVERFTTGSQHFVFDVETESGRKIVVRISRPEHRHLTQSSIFWNELLRPKGVPMPKILAADAAADFPFLILERLPGKDLWQVYADLSKAEKKALAGEMARLQTIAAALPKANSFGYLETYETDSGCRTWFDIFLKFLDRSRQRIKQNGLFEPEIVDRVERAARKYENYFARIEPVAFFDDITTKNVIVNRGKLSGIVDVDWMCFGDSLKTIALTQAALLASENEIDYIEFWCDEMNLDTVQRKVLNLYSAESCVDFIGEIGKTFNREEPIAPDEKKVKRLFEILESLLANV